MKKYFKSVITCLIFLYFLSFSNISPIVATNYSCPSNLSPQECILWGIEQTGGEAGFDTSIVGEPASWSDSAISQKIGQIISYVLAFLGVLFLIISIISGLQWMTAGGSEDKVTKAKDRLMNATVGIIIIIMAYAITYFIVGKIQSSVTPPQNQSSYPDGTPCTQVVEENYLFQCLTAEGCNSIPNSQQLYMYTCATSQVCCKSFTGQVTCIPTVCSSSCDPEDGECINGQCVCNEPQM